MYKLTLTASERQAIDWIGNRYSHGDDLFDLLCEVEWEGIKKDEDWGWFCEKDITFLIPENIAWQISDLLQNSLYECFAPELVEKLTNFCAEVI